MKHLAVALVVWVSLIGCSPRARIVRELKNTESTFQDHTGFYLYDPTTEKELINFNGAKYFTPASNTKIFTLYTSLKLLGDSLTAFHYQHRNDSLIIWPTGDPSFLYSAVHQNNRAYQFLTSVPGKVFLAFPYDSTLSPLGPGWSWSDYNYSYSAERSVFPIYGNIMHAFTNKDSTIHTRPAIFMEHIAYASKPRKKAELLREVDSNMLTYFPPVSPSSGKWDIPIRTTHDVILDLISDTLKRPVEEIRLLKPRELKEVKSIPVDSVYKVMMQESDNFLAEQLLIMCSNVVSDTLSSEVGIRYSLGNFLKDLPDKPIWIDGSGLSRYNLFTPRSIVMLWRKIHNEIPASRLFPLLAAGGVNGTIRNWYKAESPFIFGKTGTLSNNHSLSGFIITRKGKTLLFSMMSNNFIASGNDLRKQMEKILFMIRDQY